jgi:hypothetical protein
MNEFDFDDALNRIAPFLEGVENAHLRAVQIVSALAAPVQQEGERVREALEFYANPETYLAIGFFPDPPCGEFMDDFDETAEGLKPGKRARAALAQPTPAAHERGLDTSFPALPDHDGCPICEARKRKNG